MAARGVIAVASDRESAAFAGKWPFWPVVCLLVSAGLLYTVWWYGAAPVSTLDTPSYARLAHDIRNGHLEELHIRTPGFPLVMIVSGADQSPTKRYFVLSLLLYLGSAGLLAWLLRTLGVGRAVVFLFVGVALLPPFVENTVYIASETAAAASITIAIILFLAGLQGRGFCLVALFPVALSFAVLVRPTFQLLAPVLAVTGLIGILAGLFPGSPKRLIARVVFAVALSFIPLLVLAYVNYRQFDFFGLCSIAPFTVGNKTVTILENIPDEHAQLREILILHRNRVLLDPNREHMGLDYLWRAIPEVRALYGNDETRTIKTLQRVYMDLIRRKPMSVLFEAVRPVGTFWLPYDTPLATGGHSIVRALWAALQLGVVLLFLLQLIASGGLILIYLTARLWLRGRMTNLITRRDRALIRTHMVLATVILYTAVVSCLMAVGEPRYRQPVELLMFAATAIGFVLWVRAVELLRIGPQETA